MWRDRLFGAENCAPQWHVNGLLLRWAFMWYRSVFLHENAFLQIAQYGGSVPASRCTFLIWATKFLRSLNFLLQCSQVSFMSPKCFFKCSVSISFLLNLFPHSSQTNFPFLCIIKWRSSQLLNWYWVLHTLHIYFLGVVPVLNEH